MAAPVLDADVELNSEALHAVFKATEAGPLLAARPAFRYDTSGASVLVRAYYRARNRIHGNAQGLWGAGVYAMNADGHERLGEFPALTGDDYYVDRLFQPAEKAVLATDPVVVRTPRSSGRCSRFFGAHTAETNSKDPHGAPCRRHPAQPPLRRGLCRSWPFQYAGRSVHSMRSYTLLSPLLAGVEHSLRGERALPNAMRAAGSRTTVGGPGRVGLPCKLGLVPGGPG